jgi:bifunctional DNA-binding transcriptional regulator/antitoxin component of YhaV-PrlF toxin-antitoxin module
MARKKPEERNIRSVFTTGMGKSFALTLPIETLRAWGWRERQQLTLKIDDAKKRITVEALPR